MLALFLVILAVFAIIARSDTPASCFTDQFLGDWEFLVSVNGVTPKNDAVECPTFPTVAELTNTRILRLRLRTNGRADNLDTGSNGTWTAIASQGVEVTIDGWKYFWFANYELVRSYDYAATSATVTKKNTIDVVQTVVSDCGRIRVGSAWAHEAVLAARLHYCMLSGYNYNPKVVETNTSMMKDEIDGPVNPDDEDTKVKDGKTFFDDSDFSEKNRPTNYIRHFKLVDDRSVDEVNMPQPGSSDMSRPLGGKNTGYGKKEISYDMYAGDELPATIDYCNYNGKKYVIDPPLDQQGCGSCFLVASVQAISARIMRDTDLAINFNDPNQPKISLQHSLDCSQYSQACTGGFGEEVGKFAEDYGLLTTDAYGSEYLAKKNDKCLLSTSTEDDHKDINSLKNNKRYYVNSYGYLGGYFGSGESTFNAMKRELFNYGPFATSVYVNDDFRNCEPINSHQEDLISGINQQTSESEKDGSQRSYYYKRTNHLVVIVGLIDIEGVPHWVVQNSWGSKYCREKGLNGYVYIRAGTNEYNIETAPVVFTWVDKQKLSSFGGTRPSNNDETPATTTGITVVLSVFLAIFAAAFIAVLVLLVFSIKRGGKICTHSHKSGRGTTAGLDSEENRLLDKAEDEEKV